MVYLPKEHKDLYPAQKKQNKYNAKKTIVDGTKFDSKKEAARYGELKLQMHVGIISNLTLQPEFVLQDSFRYENKTIRAIKYRADFRYITSEGRDTIEDVKPSKRFTTPVYKLKKKMFLKRYPELDFIET